MPKQLTVRATVSPQASCRALLIGSAVPLFCLPSAEELEDTSFGVLPRMGMHGYYRSCRHSSRTPFRVLRTRSAVHRDVISSVSDNVGHAKSFAESTEASAWVHLKRFQLVPSGEGGAVCTIREDLNRAVERLDAKNAIRKFGGKYECVGDAKSSKVL